MSYVPSGHKPPQGRQWLWRVLAVSPWILLLGWVVWRYTTHQVALSALLEAGGLAAFGIFMGLGLPLIARATKSDL